VRQRTTFTSYADFFRTAQLGAEVGVQIRNKLMKTQRCRRTEENRDKKINYCEAPGEERRRDL